MDVLSQDDSHALLDERLLGFMEQLELLEEKRVALNSLIEQGWFSISKARYSMGNKQVSALQYACEMEPQVCVHVRTQDKGEVEFCTERDPHHRFVEDAKAIENIGPKEEGVRRRVNPEKKKGEEKDENETAKEAAKVKPVKKSDSNPQPDPLKWFGILVPQSLKQAQLSFKQVIELSAEIATLQEAVLKTRQELRHILPEDA